MQLGGAAPQRSIRVCGGEQHLVGGVVEESDVHMSVRAQQYSAVFEIIYAADDEHWADIENFNVTKHCADVSFSKTATQLPGVF